ncbi:MAG: NAD(P)-dependent alcohol dehydrogenase [Bacteroidota bacterium]
MKAIVYHKYGSPQVLSFSEVPLPPVKANQVLVKVRASGLNPIDCEIRKGRMQVVTGNRFPRIPGCDFAGDIVEVGRKVKGFEIGDAVYGMAETFTGGAYAEYLTISPGEIAPKPDNLSYEEAAAIPLAALTALQAYQNLGNIRPGMEVFIHGASGGVGVFAIQLAKAFGAKVTASASFRNTDLLKELGADRTIDYTRQNVLSLGQKFDIFFDVYGNQSLAKARKSLRPQGRYISTIPNPRNFRDQFFSILLPQKAKVVVVKSLARDLLFLRRLVEEEKVLPILDRSFDLQEAEKAQTYLESRRARGKVVLQVS